MKGMIYNPKDEATLFEYVMSYADDPVGFAQNVIRWDTEGSVTDGVSGPRGWQKELLKDIKAWYDDAKSGKGTGMYKHGISSGRGIGKSACAGMIALWFICTRIGGSVYLVANSEDQLLQFTLPEIKQWIAISKVSHWWETKATEIVPTNFLLNTIKDAFSIDGDMWGIKRRLWNEQEPAKVRGAHNSHGLMYIFDEASGIPDVIWDNIAGSFTEKTVDKYWLCFSQCHKKSGIFYRIVSGLESGWRHSCVNALNVDGVDTTYHNDVVKKYGEDSDEARVQVYGLWPKNEVDSLIHTAVVDNAVQRSKDVIATRWKDTTIPLICGIDVGGGGRDPTIIVWRRGNSILERKIVELRTSDPAQTIELIAEEIIKSKPNRVFIDQTGVGWGIYGSLKARGFKVKGVVFGASATKDTVYANKRIEMWDRMREWLIDGGAIHNEPALIQELSMPLRKIAAGGRMLLESKVDMTRRTGIDKSTDYADALALTFAEEVNKINTSQAYGPIRYGIKNTLLKGL